MAQINFRIESEVDEFLSLMSQLEKKSKSALSKEIFLKGLDSFMMPYLAQLYAQGKISIRQIARLMGLSPSDVISQVAHLIEEIDLDPSLIQYSAQVGKQLLPYLLQAKDTGISFEGTIRHEE